MTRKQAESNICFIMHGAEPEKMRRDGKRGRGGGGDKRKR